MDFLIRENNGFKNLVLKRVSPIINNSIIAYIYLFFNGCNGYNNMLIYESG